MIGIRVTCDTEGCGRHFEVAATVAASAAEWGEVLAVARPGGIPGFPRPGGAVYLGGDVVLPERWIVRDVDGFTRAYCGDHAGT